MWENSKRMHCVGGKRFGIRKWIRECEMKLRYLLHSLNSAHISYFQESLDPYFFLRHEIEERTLYTLLLAVFIQT